jgi:anti-sigma-K factor RskA
VSNHPMLDLVPLYALDALEPVEQREFEDHLDACPECRDSLDVYHEVATSLAHDEPASEATWEQISAAISIDGSVESNVVEMPRSGANAAWKWVAGIAAAVALLLGAFVVFDSLQDSQLRGEDIVAAADRIAEEPGSIVGDFVVDDAAVAQVVLSSDGQGFVIPTNDLPALEQTRTYQLWVVNDTEDVISAGVLGNSPVPATFTWTGEVTGFALTREVAGGVVSSAGDVVSVISDV